MAHTSGSWKNEIDRQNVSKEYPAVLLGYNQSDDESGVFKSQICPFIGPNEYMKKMMKTNGGLKNSSESEISTRTEVLSIDSSTESLVLNQMKNYSKRKKKKRRNPKNLNSHFSYSVPVFVNGDQHDDIEVVEQEMKPSKTLMKRLMGRIRQIFIRNKKDDWGTNNSATRPAKGKSRPTSSSGNQRGRRPQGKKRPTSSSGTQRGRRAQGKKRPTSSSGGQRGRRAQGKSRSTSSSGAQRGRRPQGKKRPTSSSGGQRGRRTQGKSRSTSSSGAQRGRRPQGKKRPESSSGGQRRRRAQGQSRSTSSSGTQRGRRAQGKSRSTSSSGTQRGRRPQGKKRPTSSSDAQRGRRTQGTKRPTSSSGGTRAQGKSRPTSPKGEARPRSTRSGREDERPSLHCLDKTGTDVTSPESDAEKAALEGRLCNVPFAAVPLNCHKKSSNPCGVPYAFLPLPGHQEKEETDARGNKRVPCGVPYAVIPMSGQSGDKEACGSPFGVFPLTSQVRYPLHEPKPYPSFIMSTGHHGPHDPHGPRERERTRRIQGHRCLRPRDICHTDSESSESTTDDSCMAEFLQDIEKKLVSKLNLQEVFMKELDNQKNNLLAERPCGSCPPQQPKSVCPVNFYSPIHRRCHINPQHHQRSCDEPGVEDRIDVMAKQLERLTQNCQESRATIEAQRKRQNVQTVLEDELAKGLFGRDIDVARQMNLNIP